MTSRLLIAIPVVFASLIAAAACSSSSNNNSGGTTPDGGHVSGTSCAELTACCAGTKIASSAAALASCEKIITAGSESSCASALTTYQNANDCASTGGSGSGTTGGSGIGSSGTGTGSSGSGTGVSGAGTCAAPGAVPVGFAPPTAIAAPGCTAAETTTEGQCATGAGIDAGACNAAASTGATSDGGLNACGTCVFGPAEADIIPGEPVSSTWGAEEIFAAYGTLGSDTSLFPFNAGFNLGACVMATNTSAAAQKCGLDFMAADACVWATCLNLCTISNMGASSSDYTEIGACVAAAQKGTCASYITKYETDCPLVGDAGANALDGCLSLYNIDEGDTEAGTATATTYADFFGTVCGGADAGI